MIAIREKWQDCGSVSGPHLWRKEIDNLNQSQEGQQRKQWGELRTGPVGSEKKEPQILSNFFVEAVDRALRGRREGSRERMGVRRDIQGIIC